MMINRLCNIKRQTGFSLVELTVVLLIITLLASVAVRETSELAFQTRYEQTRERLEMIRQAILGNPKLIVNGQQAVSGFVADMGRLPANIRELIQRSGDCSDDAGDASQAACLGLATPGTWTASAWNNDAVAKIDPVTGLRYGWNGPYLSISGNPADSDALTDGWGRLTQGYCSKVDYTSDTSCTNAEGSWTATANDFNFGWYFDTATFPNGVLIQSYGKDQSFGGGEIYDQDYPTFASQPVIKSQDWRIDISGGISVSFKKSAGKISPVSVSHCSDPTKTSKDTCLTPAIWSSGGCLEASFYNKGSCPVGKWVNCSDGTSATKTGCEAAGNEWYGEGFGCSDQAKAIKELCTSPDVWRSCSDDGTITDESACLAADQLWYGDTIFNNSLSTQKICMKVFYRKPDSTIGTLVSDDKKDNDSPTVHFDPKSIIADGSFQSLRFVNFRDSASNFLVTELPIGTNAIGIYKHDGLSCTNLFYPSDRQSPVQVDFHAHAGVSVINW